MEGEDMACLDIDDGRAGVSTEGGGVVRPGAHVVTVGVGADDAGDVAGGDALHLELAAEDRHLDVDGVADVEGGIADHGDAAAAPGEIVGGEAEGLHGEAGDLQESHVPVGMHHEDTGDGVEARGGVAALAERVNRDGMGVQEAEALGACALGEELGDVAVGHHHVLFDGEAGAGVGSGGVAREGDATDRGDGRLDVSAERGGDEIGELAGFEELEGAGPHVGDGAQARQDDGLQCVRVEAVDRELVAGLQDLVEGADGLQLSVRGGAFLAVGPADGGADELLVTVGIPGELGGEGALARGEAGADEGAGESKEIGETLGVGHGTLLGGAAGLAAGGGGRLPVLAGELFERGGQIVGGGGLFLEANEVGVDELGGFLRGAEDLLGMADADEELEGGDGGAEGRARKALSGDDGGAAVGVSAELAELGDEDGANLGVGERHAGGEASDERGAAAGAGALEEDGSPVAKIVGARLDAGPEAEQDRTVARDHEGRAR
ncbi:MAG: hypothetical protein R3B70_22185 [Polyangiaceae bacterium]